MSLTAIVNLAERLLNTSGTSTTGGFQIHELVIKFSGVQESVTQTGGAQAGSSNSQLSAFNLQFQEVNLTLANHSRSNRSGHHAASGVGRYFERIVISSHLLSQA